MLSPSSRSILCELAKVTVTLARSHTTLPDDGDHTETCCSCSYVSFNTVTLASSHSTLPDDGDHTEICWRNFNENFNTLCKAIFLFIIW